MLASGPEAAQEKHIEAHENPGQCQQTLCQGSQTYARCCLDFAGGLHLFILHLFLLLVQQNADASFQGKGNEEGGDTWFELSMLHLLDHEVGFWSAQQTLDIPLPSAKAYATHPQSTAKALGALNKLISISGPLSVQGSPFP